MLSPASDTTCGGGLNRLRLADLGVASILIKSQRDWLTSTIGRLLWAIQARYVEMENDERSESIRAGHPRARAIGKHIGRTTAGV
jgi:hypothetical protein